jgi:hypothetical protein
VSLQQQKAFSQLLDLTKYSTLSKTGALFWLIFKQLGERDTRDCQFLTRQFKFFDRLGERASHAVEAARFFWVVVAQSRVSEEMLSQMTCPWGQTHKRAALWPHDYRIHPLKCTYACPGVGRAKRSCFERSNVAGFSLYPIGYWQQVDRLPQHQIDVSIDLIRELWAGVLQQPLCHRC